MDRNTPNRYTGLRSLSFKILFAMTLLIPSIASARTAQYYAYSLEICTNNSQGLSCQTTTGDAMRARLGYLPYALMTTCNRTPCDMSTPQTWTYGYVLPDGTPTTSSQYISDPDGGTWVNYSSTLPITCWQTADWEFYSCRMGTGGPGWSIMYTVNY